MKHKTTTTTTTTKKRKKKRKKTNTRAAKQTQNKNKVFAITQNKRQSCCKHKTNSNKPEKQTTKQLQNTKTNGDHTAPPTTTVREGVVAETKTDPLQKLKTNQIEVGSATTNLTRNWSSTNTHKTNTPATNQPVGTNQPPPSRNSATGARR
jgi:hypothetical protein